MKFSSISANKCTFLDFFTPVISFCFKGGILRAHVFFKSKFLVNFPKYILFCWYLDLKKFAAKYLSLFDG
jgi:hypothetical protein